MLDLANDNARRDAMSLQATDRITRFFTREHQRRALVEVVRQVVRRAASPWAVVDQNGVVQR